MSRYLRRLSPSDQARKLWATFLRNHREVIAAIDFFTVPTLTFRVLYCVFVIEHGRRKILHFNVTDHLSSSWIVQQLREAFPEPCPYRYAVLDRDAKFRKDVTDLLVSSGIKPKRTSFRSPWQDGIAERWIGLDPIAGQFFMLKTASLSALGYENKLSQPVIEFWNDTRHAGD